MQNFVQNPAAQPERSREDEHRIQTLVKKENLNVFTPGSNTQISLGQLFMVDCRTSPPQQVKDWYVAKPAGTPFLLLSPEKDHLAAMASVSMIAPTAAQYAVLYAATIDDKVCVTALGYGDAKNGDELVSRTDPAIDGTSTGYLMDAICQSLGGPVVLDQSNPAITYPLPPPKGMTSLWPGTITYTRDIVFSTSREPVAGGTVSNTSPTSFTVRYTPYLYLQQTSIGGESNQVLIVQTQSMIETGNLYANYDYDRGNAISNLFGTLEPNSTSFYPSVAPNDFSPKTSDDNGHIDASIAQNIPYYDVTQHQIETYNFIASATYDIVDWAVTSNCDHSALGPNFYITQPTDCQPGSGSSLDGAFDKHGKIYYLPPDCCSGGTLNLWTYSSWTTRNNVLVTGQLSVNADWNVYATRWFSDPSEKHNKKNRYYQQDKHCSKDLGFVVDFSNIQPS